MNDHDLLFGMDDINRRKDGELPYPWLEGQNDALLAPYHAQTARLKKLLASADPATARRLNKPI